MIYLICGIVLVAVEMFVGTFWLLVLGIASFLMFGLVSLFPEMGYLAQAAWLVGLGVFVPNVVRRLKGFGAKPDATINKPLERYVGQSCYAEGKFESGRGRVMLLGSLWVAVTRDNMSYDAGQEFKVLEAGGDGVLVVEKA